jgi:transcription initiation factor TFIID subunit 6
MIHSKRTKLTTEDVNQALKIKQAEPLFGYSISSEPMPFRRAQGTTDLFFIPEKELDLADVVAAPFPPVAQEPSLGLHWLAVEGVQPAIPQNPTVKLVKKDFSKPDQEIPPLVKHVLSKELQLYYERITQSILRNLLFHRRAK